jgi:CheY-specific phosphatase CheX
MVEAFAAAVPFALREMAEVEAVVRDVRPADAADDSPEISAVIRLNTAGGVGRLVLGFPWSTAVALTRRVLAGAGDPAAPDMVWDCMGEVANVVAGQAKALLFDRPSHFTLSPPTVATGEPPDDRTGGWVIWFVSDAGEFTARVVPPV